MIMDFEYSSQGKTYDGPRVKTAGNVQIAHKTLIDLEAEEPIADYGTDGAWRLTAHGHHLAGKVDERPFTDFVISP